LFFPVNDRLSLGLDYMFDGFGRKTSDALVPRLTTDYKVSEQTFLFAAKAAVLKREKLTPFLFAGLGLHIAHAEADVTPQPGIIWLDTATRETRRILDDSDTAFAAAFGLGADYRVGPVLSLGIETRYQYFSEIEWQTRQISGVGNTVSTIEGSISAFALLARATFHF
jgi:opacity protein-like surface antigen